LLGRAAGALVAGASGAVTVKTTILRTPEEFDASAKKTPSIACPDNRLSKI
jgi:hypothetical protein